MGRVVVISMRRRTGGCGSSADSCVIIDFKCLTTGGGGSSDDMREINALDRRKMGKGGIANAYRVTTGGGEGVTNF